MAFFKGFRDQMKANALISHLEFARDRFPYSSSLGLDHVSGALKSMVTIKNSVGKNNQFPHSHLKKNFKNCRNE